MAEAWGWMALVGLAASSWLAVQWALTAGERRGHRVGYRAGHAAGRSEGYRQGLADARRQMQQRDAGRELAAMTRVMQQRDRAARWN